jgi:hypothetical protein
MIVASPATGQNLDLGEDGDLDGLDIPGALYGLWDPPRWASAASGGMLQLARLTVIPDARRLLHELEIHRLDRQDHLHADKGAVRTPRQMKQTHLEKAGVSRLVIIDNEVDCVRALWTAAKLQPHARPQRWRLPRRALVKELDRIRGRVEELT